MKFIKNYSLLSILISSLIIIAKLLWEINLYNYYNDIIEGLKTEKGISPSLVAEHIKAFLFYSLLPILFSIILMIVGIVKKLEYRFLAIAFVFISIIISSLPISLFLTI